jgi:anti-sigma regulatory factor (Ser/Thr protein kinase)
VRPVLQYRTSIPRCASNASVARRAIARFVQPWLTGRDLTDFECAVGEALANCVDHGGGDQISIRCVCDGEWIVVEVGDSGVGFTPPETVNRPINGPLRGYGLFLMHQFMDRVEFVDDGRCVRLSRRLPAADSREAAV